MIELYQAEWCPHCHRVRERLTELRVDFVARQVPAAKAARTALVQASSGDSIPALITDSGESVCGETTILKYLNEHFTEASDAGEHRAKAHETH